MVADRHDGTALVVGLERDLGAESVYRCTLLSFIADLQERTYRSTDDGEKVRLATLELRARLILNRWKKRDTN